MKPQAVIASILIVLRQLVATLHGMAHEQLGVGLSSGQWAFVYTVITAAPIVALVLYWTPLARFGALLLWTSMVAGMLFGIYYHFIAVSPDHVSHLPNGEARGLFVGTAILLIPCELAAAAVGFWGWRTLGGPPAGAR